jgi:putative membrane protein
MIKNILIRWLITALAVVAATWLVPGIDVTGANGWLTVIIMAAVLGLINAIIRPILALLSCGCIVVTLGLFMLVINTFTFWLASYITSAWFNLGFSVENLWAAFLGALVVSVVSFLLSMVFVDDRER